MIIANGTISVISNEGGGFDAAGNPVKATASEGEKIKANIKRTSRSQYDSGQQAWVTKEGYQIIIGIGSGIKPGDRIAVYGSEGQKLGEFQTQDAQDLHAVAATQITI
ncbi:MAG: hypothetical protein LIP09_00860 [Bacteroidales bacterium]|nr:hypothetical protein [Bacteroidales bacterium]